MDEPYPSDLFDAEYAVLVPHLPGRATRPSSARSSAVIGRSWIRRRCAVARPPGAPLVRGDPKG